MHISVIPIRPAKCQALTHLVLPVDFVRLLLDEIEIRMDL